MRPCLTGHALSRTSRCGGLWSSCVPAEQSAALVLEDDVRFLKGWRPQLARPACTGWAKDGGTSFTSTVRTWRAGLCASRPAERQQCGAPLPCAPAAPCVHRHPCQHEAAPACLCSQPACLPAHLPTRPPARPPAYADRLPACLPAGRCTRTPLDDHQGGGARRAGARRGGLGRR